MWREMSRTDPDAAFVAWFTWSSEMLKPRAATVVCLGVCAASLFAAVASAQARPRTAALQVSLRAGGFYAGPRASERLVVDRSAARGLWGSLTRF